VNGEQSSKEVRKLLSISAGNLTRSAKTCSRSTGTLSGSSLLVEQVVLKKLKSFSSEVLDTKGDSEIVVPVCQSHEKLTSSSPSSSSLGFCSPSLKKLKSFSAKMLLDSSGEFFDSSSQAFHSKAEVISSSSTFTETSCDNSQNLNVSVENSRCSSLSFENLDVSVSGQASKQNRNQNCCVEMPRNMSSKGVLVREKDRRVGALVSDKTDTQSKQSKQSKQSSCLLKSSSSCSIMCSAYAGQNLKEKLRNSQNISCVPRPLIASHSCTLLQSTDINFLETKPSKVKGNNSKNHRVVERSCSPPLLDENESLEEDEMSLSCSAVIPQQKDSFEEARQKNTLKIEYAAKTFDTLMRTCVETSEPPFKASEELVESSNKQADPKDVLFRQGSFSDLLEEISSELTSRGVFHGLGRSVSLPVGGSDWGKSVEPVLPLSDLFKGKKDLGGGVDQEFDRVGEKKEVPVPKHRGETPHASTSKPHAWSSLRNCNKPTFSHDSKPTFSQDSSVPAESSFVAVEMPSNELNSAPSSRMTAYQNCHKWRDHGVRQSMFVESTVSTGFLALDNDRFCSNPDVSRSTTLDRMRPRLKKSFSLHGNPRQLSKYCSKDADTTVGLFSSLDVYGSDDEDEYDDDDDDAFYDARASLDDVMSVGSVDSYRDSGYFTARLESVDLQSSSVFRDACFAQLSPSEQQQGYGLCRHSSEQQQGSGLCRHSSRLSDSTAVSEADSAKNASNTKFITAMDHCSDESESESESDSESTEDEDDDDDDDRMDASYIELQKFRLRQKARASVERDNNNPGHCRCSSCEGVPLSLVAKRPLGSRASPEVTRASSDVPAAVPCESPVDGPQNPVFLTNLLPVTKDPVTNIDVDLLVESDLGTVQRMLGYESDEELGSSGGHGQSASKSPPLPSRPVPFPVDDDDRSVNLDSNKPTTADKPERLSSSGVSKSAVNTNTVASPQRKTPVKKRKGKTKVAKTLELVFSALEKRQENLIDCTTNAYFDAEGSSINENCIFNGEWDADLEMNGSNGPKDGEGATARKLNHRQGSNLRHNHRCNHRHPYHYLHNYFHTTNFHHHQHHHHNHSNNSSSHKLQYFYNCSSSSKTDSPCSTSSSSSINSGSSSTTCSSTNSSCSHDTSTPKPTTLPKAKRGKTNTVQRAWSKRLWAWSPINHDRHFLSHPQLRVNQDDLEAEMTLRIQEEEEETRQETITTTTAVRSSVVVSASSKTHLRANVVHEIITAEAEYVKHLRDVIEVSAIVVRLLSRERKKSEA
jgi:hypothetical protein